MNRSSEAKEPDDPQRLLSLGRITGRVIMENSVVSYAEASVLLDEELCGS
jgi:hypothetical protein